MDLAEVIYKTGVIGLWVVALGAYGVKKLISGIGTAVEDAFNDRSRDAAAR